MGKSVPKNCIKTKVSSSLLLLSLNPLRDLLFRQLQFFKLLWGVEKQTIVDDLLSWVLVKILQSVKLCHELISSLFKGKTTPLFKNDNDYLWIPSQSQWGMLVVKFSRHFHQNNTQRAVPLFAYCWPNSIHCKIPAFSHSPKVQNFVRKVNSEFQSQNICLWLFFVHAKKHD